MNVADAADIIDAAWQGKGQYSPSLRDELDFDTALAVQLELLSRRVARGEQQAGWKIGLTSERVRQRLGSDRQPFGHIMRQGVHASGARVAFDDIGAGASIEPELCVIMKNRLVGPGVTPEMARDAVAAIAAGMEINQNRLGELASFPYLIADNLTQWGIMEGEAIPVPEGFDFEAMLVTMHCDGELKGQGLGKEVIDDHFLSVATLANILGEHGQALLPGQRIITGSYFRADIAPGQSWVADFPGIGSVEINVD